MLTKIVLITGIQRRLSCAICLFFVFSPLSANAKAFSIQYATPIESAEWVFSGSRFSCEMQHAIHGFGTATFEQQAGLKTRFLLHSKQSRLKAGKASLVAKPPMWLSHKSPLPISNVNVGYGAIPIKVGRKLSERMLAELEKGMNLHFIRQPWYEDGQQSLNVVVPSINFQQSYQEYLSCLAALLPVNFSQVAKRALNYDNYDSALSKKTMKYLDKVAFYIKEDPEVKVIYIDAHTDSQGVRADNLLKSKERAERVMAHLQELGVPDEKMIVRWHGERYKLASNQTAKGRAKNRRVTVRLSKEDPPQTTKTNQQSDEILTQ